MSQRQCPLTLSHTLRVWSMLSFSLRACVTVCVFGVPLTSHSHSHSHYHYRAFDLCHCAFGLWPLAPAFGPINGSTALTLPHTACVLCVLSLRVCVTVCVLTLTLTITIMPLACLSHSHLSPFAFHTPLCVVRLPQCHCWWGSS